MRSGQPRAPALMDRPKAQLLQLTSWQIIISALEGIYLYMRSSLLNKGLC